MRILPSFNPNVQWKKKTIIDRSFLPHASNRLVTLHSKSEITRFPEAQSVKCELANQTPIQPPTHHHHHRRIVDWGNAVLWCCVRTVFTIYWTQIFIWLHRILVFMVYKIKRITHPQNKKKTPSNEPKLDIQTWEYLPFIRNIYGKETSRRRALCFHHHHRNLLEFSIYSVFIYIFFFVRCPRHLPDSLFCISNKPIWQIKIADVFYAELTVIFFSISLNGKEGGCLHNNSYVSAVTFVEPRTQQKIKKKKCSRPRQCILPRG